MKRLAVLLALGGCGYLPQDADNTSQRVAQTRVVRIGIAGEVPEARAFLSEVARVTRARPRLEHGSLEPLLARLEKDELELVVAPFAEDSMWAERVALTPPLDGSEIGDKPVAPQAAARNGENAWIMTVERAARAGAGK
ncbi:MAG: hypothetical protein V4659_05195 [Pseudomonadota bacterium]